MQLSAFAKLARRWGASGGHALEHAGMGTGIGVYYDRNSLTMLGDSRLAQCYVDPGHLVRNAANFIPQALALSGQRFRIANNLAVSGQRSNQYLSAANVAAALATNSFWLMIYGVVNDISAYSNTVDYWTTYIKPVVQQWIASGRSVILCTETGANSFAGSGANYMGPVIKYNRQIRDFCRANPNAVLFDVAALVMQPGTAMTFNPAYSGDGVHVNLVAGANVVGQAFANLLSTLAPPCDGLVRSVDNVYANGGVQWFSNPLFTTTTGGSGGVMTGSVPLGITSVVAPSGTTIANTIVAGSYGNKLQMAITTTQAGLVQLQMDLTGVATDAPGDVFYANSQWDLAAGSSGFAWAGSHLESNRAGSTTYVEDGYVPGANGVLPSGAQSWVSETERLTIPSGARGWLLLCQQIYFNSAGSATLSLSRVGAWRQPAY